jgi:hypothetical protein
LFDMPASAVTQHQEYAPGNRSRRTVSPSTLCGMSVHCRRRPGAHIHAPSARPSLSVQRATRGSSSARSRRSAPFARGRGRAYGRHRRGCSVARRESCPARVMSLWRLGGV